MPSASGSGASGNRRRSPSPHSGGRIADRTRAKVAKGAYGNGAADGDTGDQRGAHDCMRATSAWQGEGARDILTLLFNSGYVSQATAYNCMLVCNMWLQCVHHAPRLWRRIEFVGPKACAAFGDNWTQQILDGITAKRAKHMIFCSPDVSRAQLSATLQCNGQLAVLDLTYCQGQVDTTCALDSLSAPLHTLEMRTCGTSPLHDTAFADIVASAPVLTQLSVLDLSGSSVGDASVQLIAARFTQLRELVLTWCPEVTATAVSHLAADTAHTRNTLRKLRVGYSGTTGDITSHILAMPNLERLEVGWDSSAWANNLQAEYSAKYGRRLALW